jgi:hypothetical protein
MHVHDGVERQLRVTYYGRYYKNAIAYAGLQSDRGFHYKSIRNSTAKMVGNFERRKVFWRKVGHRNLYVRHRHRIIDTAFNNNKMSELIMRYNVNNRRRTSALDPTDGRTTVF